MFLYITGVHSQFRIKIGSLLSIKSIKNMHFLFWIRHVLSVVIKE